MKRLKYDLLVLALRAARRLAISYGCTRAVLLDAEGDSGYAVARSIPVLRDGLFNPVVAKDGQVQGESYVVT